MHPTSSRCWRIAVRVPSSNILSPSSSQSSDSDIVDATARHRESYRPFMSVIESHPCSRELRGQGNYGDSILISCLLLPPWAWGQACRASAAGRGAPPGPRGRRCCPAGRCGHGGGSVHEHTSRVAARRPPPCRLACFWGCAATAPRGRSRRWRRRSRCRARRAGP